MLKLMMIMIGNMIDSDVTVIQKFTCFQRRWRIFKHFDGDDDVFDGNGNAKVIDSHVTQFSKHSHALKGGVPMHSYPASSLSQWQSDRMSSLHRSILTLCDNVTPSCTVFQCSILWHCKPQLSHSAKPQSSNADSPLSNVRVVAQKSQPGIHLHPPNDYQW